MNRRLFLQLATAFTAAASLPLVTLREEGLVSLLNSEGHHIVLVKGTFKGRLYDPHTELWTKSPSSYGSFPMFLERNFGEYLEGYKGSREAVPLTPIPSYGPSDFASMTYERVPGLDERTARALSCYKRDIASRIEDILTKVGHPLAADVKLVTVVKSPIKLTLATPHQSVEVRASLEHYLVQGSVKSDYIWSTNGELPLDVDYDSKKLREWYEERIRKNLVLENSSGIRGTLVNS